MAGHILERDVVRDVGVENGRFKVPERGRLSAALAYKLPSEV